YRVFVSEYFGIVPFNNAVVGGIGNFYVVGCRGKTPNSVKIHTVAFNNSAFVVNTRFFYEIAGVVLGVIKAAFTINLTVFSGYSAWTVHKGIPVFGEVIQTFCF